MMELNEFKAGVYHQQYQYKSFSPFFVNHEWNWADVEIDKLLAEAAVRLEELNKLSKDITEIDSYLDMCIAKEALSSCKIEGTKLRFDEMISLLDSPGDTKKDDMEDVRNYIEALRDGIEGLKRLPLSTRIFNNMHTTLFDNERGEKKTPGEYRKSQNWVGGKTLKEALYIPPTHEELPGLMGDLENFIHNEEIGVPHLIKLAIVHYQFMTIHPYLDGNGKIARLIIPLYLHDFGLLSIPVLNLSEQLEKSKTEYLVKLAAARERDALDIWIKFFLRGVIQAARVSIDRLKAVPNFDGEIDINLFEKIL